jgi:hypothetical protein
MVGGMEGAKDGDNNPRKVLEALLKDVRRFRVDHIRTLTIKLNLEYVDMCESPRSGHEISD